MECEIEIKGKTTTVVKSYVWKRQKSINDLESIDYDLGPGPIKNLVRMKRAISVTLRAIVGHCD